MTDENGIAQGNKDRPRTSSPSADLIHSHKIRSVDDPSGTKEAEINKLAKRLARLNPEKDSARILFLREKLVSSAMSYFYITGDNVETREDGVTHQGHYTQVDELFIDVLMKVVDAYDPGKGLFTHMLRNKYRYARLDAAIAAAAEDTALGGGEEGSPLSLDEKAWHDGDGSATVADVAGTKLSSVDDGSLLNCDPSPQETNSINSESSDDLADEALLLNVISLITGFLGKSGKAANETRKLYTKMFFSETLTRIVKTRGVGELGGLERQQKGLFNAVEIGFQDSYTQTPCRTILQLWLTGFVEGIPTISMVLNDDPRKEDLPQDYSWTLPANIFIAYLKGLGKAASDQLVSQQRSHYERLLESLSM